MLAFVVHVLCESLCICACQGLRGAYIRAGTRLHMRLCSSVCLCLLLGRT